METLQTLVTIFAVQVVAALIIFLVFWFAAGIGRSVIRRMGRNNRVNPDVINLLAQVVFASILIFGALTSLGTMGVDMTAMVAGLGLTGLALGLALKDIVSNAISGVLILIYEPFRRGDTIKVSGEQGIVVEITLRYTDLKTETDRILIPNSNIFNSTVVVINKYKPAGSQPLG